jgi:tetratricopeptide (TPR) repeat protein
MREAFGNNPYLLWSFIFFASFITLSFFVNIFKRVYKVNIDGGKVQKENADIFKALKEGHFKDIDSYLETLKKLAKKYPEETYFFIMAGDVIRKKNPRKALEIHRELLFRSSVSGKLRSLVLKQAARDYMVLGKAAGALNLLKESVKLDDDSETRKLLSKTYEMTGDYVSAFENMKKSLKIEGVTDEGILRELISKFIVNSQNNEEKIKWISELRKFSQKNEGKLLSLALNVLNGKQKKSQSLLKDIVEENDLKMEISARSLISTADWGKEVNGAVESRFRTLFEKDIDKYVFECTDCSCIIKRKDVICSECLNVSFKNIYKTVEV